MKRKFGILTFVAALLVSIFAFSALTACHDETKENVSITMSQKEITLSVGESQKLTVSVTPEDAEDKTIEWKSSDNKIATVENGLVKAVAEGETTVTATTNGKSDSCKIIVKAQEESTSGDKTEDSADSAEQ